MKPGTTDITLILDRSGSMGVIRLDTIGGVNTFLEDQKKLPGEATFSLIQFDDKYEVDYLRKPLAEAEALTEKTYIPRGSTALLDAIGLTLASLKEAHAKLPEDERPEKTIVVIQTDGQENASHEYTRAQIKSLIEAQEKDAGWAFIFLGANQDAISVAQGMGIQANRSMTYAHDGIGTRSAYVATSSSVGGLRAGMDVGFSQAERDEQKR